MIFREAANNPWNHRHVLSHNASRNIRSKFTWGLISWLQISSIPPIQFRDHGKHLYSVISSNYVAPLNVCSCPACIFKLIFQRVIDFIAEERGNLGSLVAFRPNTNSKIDKRSRISNARQIVLGDDPYSGSSCIVYWSRFPCSPRRNRVTTIFCKNGE